MTDGDGLRRFLFERGPIRGHVVRLDSAWRAMIENHAYPEPVRDTLGEAVAAAVLVAATIKFEGQLTLQMQGTGPMHLLVAQCTDGMAVRGVARWRGDIALQPLAVLTGDGQVTVTIENEDRSTHYQGVVPLSGDRIAECLENYFERSEQLPTRLWLAADGAHSVGLLLQRLPASGGPAAFGAAADDDADELWPRVNLLAATLTATELLTLDAAELLRRLFHEEDLRLFEPAPVFFRCRCSRERVQGILRSLGAAEVRSILAERGNVEVCCEFCNRAYQFDAVDVEALLAADRSAAAPAALQ
jgi:molecular chaperone Hsp33